MRIGVLEVLTDSVSHGWVVRHYDSRFRRQYASITPQAVAVWCQQLGHEVHYATDYGQSPPETLLPDELDVVFLATYTQASVLAYALARLYRRRGALTRNPYLMESSLSILRGPRLHRLKETSCLYVAPGVESWTDYSNKAGVGRSVGQAKLKDVIEHFEELHRYVPGLQANFLFGTDGDQGEEPVEMTREFIRRLPFVWPTLNIPIPFGGTPMYDRFLAEGRILREIPFAFYYTPYMVIRPKHYDPLTYYDLLIRLYRTVASGALLLRRLRSARTRGLGALHALRTLGVRSELGRLRAIRARIARDPELLAYLEGRSPRLPAFYREGLRARLGSYRSLLSEEELRPVLEAPGSASPAVTTAKVVALGGRRAAAG
jgi:hypothetical protein